MAQTLVVENELCRDGGIARIIESTSVDFMQFQLFNYINKEHIHTLPLRKNAHFRQHCPLLIRRPTAAFDEEVPALEAGVCLFPSLSCQRLQGIEHSSHVSVATAHKQQTIRLTFNCDFQQNEASLASFTPSLSLWLSFSFAVSLTVSFNSEGEFASGTV